MINSELFKKYIRGECTVEECQLIEDWLAQYNADKPIDFSEINQMLDSMDKKLDSEIPLPSSQKNYWLHVLVAASVLLFSTFFFIRVNQEDPQDLVAQNEKLAPTGNNAIIILEDGSTYKLDDLKQFDTIDANSYLITRNQEGQLIYIEKYDSDVLVYNTIQTNYGGIVNFELSDGSQVWINSKSKITYPIKFSENSREVSLEGEAYFEVVSSKELKNHPAFFVKTKQHTLEVLGTHFNVNSYKNHYQVALMEGHVEIKNNQSENNSIQLYPNDFFNGKTIQQVNNIEQSIDWKEGYFDITNLTLIELTDKMTNWYGVEFSVDNAMKSTILFGKISMKKPIDEVLELLSNTIPITYKIESKKAFIYKKLI
ncbi:FecR family protein [Sphingobacterium hungaricum]